MNVAEWADKYGIHHWRILWSSYRKLAWVGFESTTTEPLFIRCNQLSYQAMCPALTQSQLSTATSILSFTQCHISFWPFAFVIRHVSSIEVFCKYSSVAEWTDQINIHHWRILGTSFRTLTWVALETATSEPFSDTLTNWTIRPYVQLALRANFVLPIQFHYLFSVKFHFGRWLPSVATFI